MSLAAHSAKPRFELLVLILLCGPDLAPRPVAPQGGPVIQAIGDAIGIIEVIPHIQAADNRCQFQTERLRPKQIVILVRTAPPMARLYTFLPVNRASTLGQVSFILAVFP